MEIRRANEMAKPETGRLGGEALEAPESLSKEQADVAFGKLINIPESEASDRLKYSPPKLSRVSFGSACTT